MALEKLQRMALLQALFTVPLLAIACATAGDVSGQGVLQLPTGADASEAAGAALTYTVFPVNGTLLAGQDLMQVKRPVPNTVHATPHLPYLSATVRIKHDCSVRNKLSSA